MNVGRRLLAVSGGGHTVRATWWVLLNPSSTGTVSPTCDHRIKMGPPSAYKRIREQDSIRPSTHSSSPRSRPSSMVMARSALFLIILLLINCSVAVRKPWISQKEQELRLSSHAVYFNAYGANHHAPVYTKYYSHLAGGHENLEQQALEHAHIPGNGPFFVHGRHGNTKLFLATQVKANTRLGYSWNLRHNNDGQVVTYDAHLSWRVDKEGVKLLRLEIWPGGSDPAVRMTMQEAINLLRRKPG